jgi:hypothetical protein
MEIQEIDIQKECICFFFLSSIKPDACNFPLVEGVLFSLVYAPTPDARLAEWLRILLCRLEKAYSRRFNSLVHRLNWADDCTQLGRSIKIGCLTTACPTRKKRSQSTEYMLIVQQLSQRWSSAKMIIASITLFLFTRDPHFFCCKCTVIIV